MGLICKGCGATTEFNFGESSTTILCKECSRKVRVEKDKLNLTNESLIDWLQLFGWFYFFISIIGGIILIVSATSETQIKTGSLFYNYEVVKSTNPLMIGMGITTLIQGLVILLILLALAKILKQNNYLICKIKD